MVKAGSGTTRRVPASVSERTLKKDLARYCKQALEMGASEAMAIPADIVEVDERVRLKCLIGRCYNYGQCVYCPPHTPDPEVARRAFRLYRWAVIFRADIPVADFADINRADKEGNEHIKRLMAVSASIESMAFADGYYLAMGLGCGNCRGSLCDGLYCQALDSGRCRFPLRARPSMEAMGINVFGLVTRIGWKIYPIYRSINPELVPCASATGLIFIC